MAHFSCPRCNITIGAPFCPSCNQFLTDDVAVAESIMAPLSGPEGKIKWCTAFGHWGDVFCCCGVMKEILRQAGQEKTNVFFVGPDMDVVAWLAEQDFVDRVMAVQSTKDGYGAFWGATTKPGTNPVEWMKFLSMPTMHPPTDLLPDSEDFTQTHINALWFETRAGLPAQMWEGGKIPEKYLHRAGMMMHSLLPNFSGKLYHIHPVSVSSELAGNHWPHWLAAIEWLLEKTPHTYVVTGLEHIAYLPTHPRLVNLTRPAPTRENPNPEPITRSNLEVLAISGFCSGVITTPNNVAIWSVIVKQKCLTIGNKATEFLTSYYRRFLEHGEDLTFLNVNTPFSAFQAAACEFLAE